MKRQQVVRAYAADMGLLLEISYLYGELSYLATAASLSDRKKLALKTIGSLI